MNTDWLHTKRPARGPTSDAEWEETGPFMESALDIDASFTQQQQFEVPHHPAGRSMHSNGQHGRGRLVPGSTFEITKSPEARQSGTAGPWMNFPSPELRRPNVSSSFEDPREIAILTRRFCVLEEKFGNRNRELEAKVARLEDQVTRLNDLKTKDISNELVQGEKFRDLMKENNTMISGWLDDTKAVIRRFIDAGVRPDGGSRGTWEYLTQGDDAENEGMLF